MSNDIKMNLYNKDNDDSNIVSEDLGHGIEFPTMNMSEVPNKKEFVKEQWNEFNKNGLLWLVDSILHLFGWSIVMEVDDDDDEIIYDVYPERTKFRGFSEDINTDGYQRVTKYLKDNVSELLKDTEE